MTSFVVLSFIKNTYKSHNAKTERCASQIILSNLLRLKRKISQGASETRVKQDTAKPLKHKNAEKNRHKKHKKQLNWQSMWIYIFKRSNEGQKDENPTCSLNIMKHFYNNKNRPRSQWRRSSISIRAAGQKAEQFSSCSARNRVWTNIEISRLIARSHARLGARSE